MEGEKLVGLLDNIKQQAQGNKTKIQTSEATRLEHILNNALYLDKNVEEETKFVRMVMTRGYENQERAGLHASSMIVGEKDWCVRRQVLSLLFKQAQGEQIPVPLKRIFEEGNSVHEKWQRIFIRAGYSDATKLDVTQFNKQFMISYTPDIICTIPEFYDGEMIGEIKSVNTYQFQKMTRHPSAGKQLQYYMHWTGIRKGFVLSEDKNNQDIKLEVYDYDPLSIAEYIDRGEEVKLAYHKTIETKVMVERPAIATGPSCKLCDKCYMKDACYNIGMGRIRLK